MIGQFILLSVLVFLSPLFPPVVVPFSYTVIGWLLVDHVNPWLIAAISVILSTISCMVTRLLWVHLHEKVGAYQEKKQRNDFFSRAERKIEAWFAKRETMNAYAQKLQRYTEKRKGKVVLFIVVVFLFQSALPDVLGIKFLHKKMSFGMFTLSAFLGKLIVYLPVIFIGKTALELIRTKL
ncbi:hypothetical protein KBC03_07505 [Patescibacteria group bacterium]|nr:hypothetical protein [Patescibacteria group bacterium]